MENFNLKTHNYKLSLHQKKEIQRKLEFFLRQVPCDSRVFLDLDYKNKIFYGKLKVDFSGKSFFSKGEDILPGSLAGSLFKKALKQVIKWKKSRTVEEITGIIAFEPRSNQAMADLSVYKKAG